MVRGELLDRRAPEQPEVRGNLEQAGGDTLQRRICPSVLRSTTAIADVAQVLVQVLRAYPERAGVIGGKEPSLQEVPQQELVARHVPEQDRLPLVQWAAVLGEYHKWAIPARRVE